MNTSFCRLSIFGRLLRLLWLVPLVSPAPGVAAPPNIVLILADDLGYGDVACYGGNQIRTPHIDALAAAGMKFTHYYDASGVCTPTRASILTGCYPLRFGITQQFRDGDEHLVRQAVTLPKLLKPAGYQTVHVGKWHLGGLNRKHIADRVHGPPGPHEQGFDHYLSMNEEPEPRARLVRMRQLYHQGSKYLYRDDQPADLSPEHLTEVEIDESIRYLELLAAAKKPFFLNVWFDVPHKPYEAATEEYVAPYRGDASGDVLFYRSMVAHLDGGVGRIMAALRRLGMADNTIVLFSSDNGPTGPGSAGPWRGGKGTLFEGGLRLPLIVAWPGHISAGVVRDEFAFSADLVPTLCEATGVALPAGFKPDGQSLWPLLLGKGPAPKRGRVFWAMGVFPSFQEERHEKPPYATEAVRSGGWKLMTKAGEPVSLFDVERDPQEKQDVLKEHAALAAELAAAVKAWLAEPRVTVDQPR